MSTAIRRKKAKRYQKIYNERQQLLALPGAMATAVDELLSKKHKLSRSTIYNISKRYQSSTQHGINSH